MKEPTKTFQLTVTLELLANSHADAVKVLEERLDMVPFHKDVNAMFIKNVHSKRGD